MALLKGLRRQVSALSFLGTSALLGVTSISALTGCDGAGTEAPQPAASPILFVTQTPLYGGFDAVTQTFGNHKGDASYAPRGGDLMIAYPDGALRNLTQEAGFGVDVGQDIAVREPSVHWDATRAVFAMAIGGTVKNDYEPKYWQIYEVTGLAQGEKAHIQKVPNQPESFNNVSPTYGTDGRILFTTDRPRSGNMKHYPQLDEYESVQTNTGLWSFDPAVEGGDLRILSHVPSGVFSPKVALDGRVIYVRWDHLQRDQQADADKRGDGDYGSFDYVSEDSDEHAGGLTENFPEPGDPTQLPSPNYHRHIFNQFFPWQINEDGTEEETVNHVGRHEMNGYIESQRDDLPYHSAPDGYPPITNFLHVMEDLHKPGRFYGTNSPEFATHSSGELVAFDGQLGVNADDMHPIHITDPITFIAPEKGAPEEAGADGRYRNPLPMSDGSLLAVYNPDSRSESGEGSGPFGNKTYKFRIHHMVEKEGTPYMTAGAPLTAGITKKVAYFDNQSYTDAVYEGELWELDPVEVVPREMPESGRTFEVPAIERKIIDDAMAMSGGYDALRQYLKDQGLALLISRNVTRRADEQQPFNLAIPGGASTIAEGGTPEEIQYIQFFQADQVRAYDNFRPGRRPVPREMHDAPDSGEGPEGSYPLGKDGSFAALVPTRRGVSWQLTAPDGTGVVRERYWLTFQPGEIRVCPNCHGINKTDVVLNEPTPQNPPETLAPLLESLFQ